MNKRSLLKSKQAPRILKAFWMLASIFVITALLFVLTVSLQGGNMAADSAMGAWTAQLDPAMKFDIVANAAELLAAILAIAITVVAIIVELAANRYSHRITSLFVREPINISVLCFFVVATVYCLWIGTALEATGENAMFINAGFYSSLFMVTVALLILLPYFAFVLSFLSPVNVIGKIQKVAFDSILEIGSRGIETSQLAFMNAIDELQDIVRRSSEMSDRAVEMASINSMFSLVFEYQKQIESLGKTSASWFDVSGVVSEDPDFVSINSTLLEDISAKRTWVEVKILRQYLDLVSDSNASSRDTSYLIAINTKRIAVESVNYRPHLELVDLCLQGFNSYLRATINNRDSRTGYYIMNQYRMLGEELLKIRKHGVVSKVALFLQFYGLLGFRQNIPFLLEVAAEDIAELAAQAVEEPLLLNELVTLLLDLDQELKKDFQNESLLGVRRAQLKLAALLLEHGDESNVRKICQDLKGENPERLQGLLSTLANEDRKEFWEFTDRGVNFAYLEPKYRRHLHSLAKLILITE